MGTPLAPNLADNSGNTSPEILTPLERVRRGFNAKTATALLALVVGAGSAQAQTQVATITTPTATTPAPASSVKGGGQVVKIDGVEYTFAKIAEMKEEEQMRIVEKARPEDQEKIANFILSFAQVAIEEGKRIDTGTQIVIEKGRKLDDETLVTMLKIIEKGGTLRKIDRPYIESLAKGPPPNPLAEEIIKRANFA